MTRCTTERLAAAERFIWLTARVLEQRRFEHLHADGSAAAVRTALEAYRCADGGFGYGLEPDARGPVSQPLQAWTALMILDEIGQCTGAAAHEICDYLAGITRPDGGVPAGDVRLAGYPHAPWMPAAEEPEGSLLSTALLAGVLHQNRIEHPWLAGADEFCWSVIDSRTETHPYEARAAVAFLDRVPQRERAAAAAERFGEMIREAGYVLLDPDHPERANVAPGYASGEVPGPCEYAPEPTSLARAWFSDEEMARGLDDLAAQQQDDGGWPISWLEWAPGTALEGRPKVTLDALRTLHAYD
ncbi:hypothetical protein GCM10009854_35810 [Saccharopolyspora halophila]|uniref:Prenyltransferase n=1 Tax=Saccharopolyspora halophila TaxID=405551 RepID=A0ABN3GLE9_9PSEU